MRIPVKHERASNYRKNKRWIDPALRRVIARAEGFPRHIDRVFRAIHSWIELLSVAVSKSGSTRDFHRNNAEQTASMRRRTFHAKSEFARKSGSWGEGLLGTPQRGEIIFTAWEANNCA
ncbi:hypothetical protein EBX31_07610 [bacterium]|nr:hypothetical protein [bacterium]